MRKLKLGVMSAIAVMGFGLLSVARADTVTATLTGVDSGFGNTVVAFGTYSGIGVGTINWANPVLSPTNSVYAPAFTNPFVTYCIDIPDHIQVGGSFSFVPSINLAGAPQPSSGLPTGMGAAAASQLYDLFGSGYSTSLSSPVEGTAFQLAIWQIVYGAAFTAVPGGDITPTALTDESLFLTHIGSTPYNGTLLDLMGVPSSPLLGQSVQDQILAAPAGTTIITSGTPLPSAATGGSVLLIGLGLATWRRNRLARASA